MSSYESVPSMGSEDVDLNGLVAEIAGSLRDADPAPEAFVIGDLPRVRGVRSQLRLVLADLMRGALEYACADEPRVMISAARSGGTWEIRVDDNGDGTPSDEREHIFDNICQGPGPLGGCRVRFTVPDELLAEPRSGGRLSRPDGKHDNLRQGGRA